MKKLLLMMLAAAVVVACEKPSVSELVDGGAPETGATKTKNFTFTVKGDFSSPTFGGEGAQRAAGYLTADGVEMTNLWVFDFVNGECVQKLVQTPSDADWGAPRLALTYGSHHIYFVASRGSEPVVDETAHAITWGTARDTFWKDYAVDVVSTSNGNRAVTLDRVVTKLKITITDAIPADAKTISLTPDEWYYGLDYTTGAAVGSNNRARSVDVSGSVGTEGVGISIYSISGTTEWTTDVALVATKANGDVLGEVALTDVPFKANRSTEYSGPLFGSSGNVTVTLNSDWDTAVTGTW